MGADGLDTIHLIYGSDDNYWFPTAVSAASAGFGASRPICIHLFDLGVSDEHYAEYERIVKKANTRTECTRHVIDPEMFSGFGSWRGSLATYSRMFIQDILPDIDWAIYVDGDTLWLGDIARLWDSRDASKLIQASVDPPMPLGEKHPDEDWYVENGLEVPRGGYLCMGLMMVNLKGMRDAGISAKCKDFMRSHSLPRVVDQTVLNYVCKGRTAALPAEWGVFSVWHGTADLTKNACVHFVNDLPWRRDKLNRLISDVVLLWYVFSEKVLDMRLRRRYLSWFDWALRRGIFRVCKMIQPLVRMNRYVHSRLRNTHGLRRVEWATILGRWK